MKVESGCSFTSPSINVVYSSSRDVLPPRGFGAALPVSRQCCHHLTAVLTAIPKAPPLRAETPRMQPLRSRACANQQNRIAACPHPYKGESMPTDSLILNAL